MITKEDVIKSYKLGKLSMNDIVKNGLLLSVTNRIKFIKQPKGGYLNPKDFEVIDLNANNPTELNPIENISPSLVGTAVDYLTRFMTGADIFDAFHISFLGAKRLGDDRRFARYLMKIKGLDEESIVSAIRLGGYDCVLRVGPQVYKQIDDFFPDKATVDNVRIMVNRSLDFFRQYGPKVLDGLTFEGGYTGYIASGDGDFLTQNTLWDFKVSKQRLQSTQTLQLLIYWRMGLHSKHQQLYEPIKYLGIFNPRLNVIYRIAVKDIDGETISNVEEKVIGY